MPYANEHAARVVDPGQFPQDSFRRKSVAKGVDIVMGNKDGRMMVQSYRFDASLFTADKAREWLQSNGVKYMSFEKAVGMMQSFVSLVAPIQALSSIDILSLIPAETLAEIKAKNPTPFFQAYSICHEGTSTPAILGDTAKPIHWTRAAVQSIKNTVLKGVKFFAGHNADNSTNGREALGEIVADVQKEIDGVLHHIVVGYFPDKEKVANKDICSQEADWKFFEAAGQWFADTLDKITGIALSNSEIDKPAFSGAKRLGMLQAFDETKKRKVKAMGDIDLSTLSFDALQRELVRRQTRPSQLFTEQDIKSDVTLGKVFTQVDTLTKTIAEKDALLTKSEKEKADATKANATVTAKTRYDALIDKMTLTDKIKTYLKSAKIDSVADLTDDGLKKFADAKIEEFQGVASVLGIKEDLPVQRATDDKTQKPGEEQNMNLAKNNPLLEEDIPTA